MKQLLVKNYSLTFLEIDVNSACQIMLKQNPRSTLWFWENSVSQLLCLALKGIPWKQETTLSLHCDHEAICLTSTVCSREYRPMRSPEMRALRRHVNFMLSRHQLPRQEGTEWPGCGSMSGCMQRVGEYMEVHIKTGWDYKPTIPFPFVQVFLTPGTQWYLQTIWSFCMET